MKARIITAILILSLAFGMVSCGKDNITDAVQQAQSEVTQEEYVEPKIVLSRIETVPEPRKQMGIPEEVAVGDRVRFGKHLEERDKKFAEPIEWRVLDVQDDRVLLVTHYVIDRMPFYHEEETEVTWEDCSLRAWLNGDFYDAAFSDEEKARVLETPTEGSLQDKVFLLSLDECRQYFTFNAWDEKERSGYSQELMGFATTYAQSRRAEHDYSMSIHTQITEKEYNEKLKAMGYTEKAIEDYGCTWWLRPQEAVKFVPVIIYHGGTDRQRAVAFGGVRPAIWVRR